MLPPQSGGPSALQPRPGCPVEHGIGSVPDGHRWVIVLAGGSGTRLTSLTTQAVGTTVPKQYCSLDGARSLLGDALARAAELAAADRIVTIVASQHEAHWRRTLTGCRMEHAVVQPENRGTAAGILLPLLSIVRRDPDAQVTLLPSDHFVADESRLVKALRDTQDAAERASDRVLLVGFEPEGPETDYGWILPGPGRRPTRAVQRFVEKPGPRLAAELMRAGAVWNSFLLVGSARAILGLYTRRLPQLLDAFLAAGDDAERLRELYTGIPDADFCRQVLTGSEEDLGLRIVPACGWTDLGTPERVARCAASLAGAGSFAPGSLAAAACALER